MNWTARNGYGDSKSFKCSCGVHLYVSITKQDGQNEQEAYNCPSCGKEYIVRASLAPTVKIIDEPGSS